MRWLRSAATTRLPAGAVLCATALLAGCVPLPIPHKVTPHPRVEGTLVDSGSMAPVPSATVEFEIRGQVYSATSDDDGRFVIEPVDEWGYLWILPLVPLDPTCRRVEIRVVAADGRRACPDTRELTVCGPTVIVGDTGQQNRRQPQDLGTVTICPGP